MEDLTTLNMTELVDLLAEHMDEYYKRSHDLNHSEKFFTCYSEVKAIQEEIDSRKKKLGHG